MAIPAEWTIRDNLDHPSKHAADHLNRLLEGTDPILFLSAGGSALTVLNHGIEIPPTVDVSTTVIDERFVSDQGNRNFYQLQQTNFVADHKGNESFRLIDPWPSTSQSLTATTSHWRQQIASWLQANPDGKVIALMGVGADGHIAGIFPHREDKFINLYKGNPIVVGWRNSDIDNEFTSRITTTPVFISEQIDTALLFAVGDRKRTVLTNLMQTDKPTHQQPAQILKTTPMILTTDLPLI